MKLSSEAAGGISITPVVVEELPTRELIEHLLRITGKDELRIREILHRGTLVTGGSRFRWSGWDADPDGLRAVLATFPDPDPSLPFAGERCLRAVLHGGREAIELSREAAERKGRFEHRSFWESLMEVIAAGEVAYAGYSYGDQADRYLRVFSAAEAECLRAESRRVSYSTLREQIRSAVFSRAELYAARRKSESGAR